LVDGITALVEEDHPGIHHMAGRDWVSMYDFALAIVEGFNLDRGLVIPADAAPGGTRGAESQDDTAESRSPDMLGLDCAKTMRLLGLAQPGLHEGIATMRAMAQGP
jgi:dTDP-4-dehydrorhamnose reductase